MDGATSETFVPAREAKKVLQVSYATLRRLCDSGSIQCVRNGPKGCRFYNIRQYINKSTNFQNHVQSNTKKSICYCRVSSRNQKDDLERQIAYMRIAYPKHEIVSDIGSGLNYKRKGFKTILDDAIQGNIKEIVVAHKDRLCRFGFEFFESIVKKYSNGQLLVLNDEKLSPESELAKDILQVLTVFSARVNGFRKYSKKIKKDTDIPKQNSGDDI